MNDDPTPTGNGRELSLATVAFAACFYAWALLGPLGPDLQEQLDLSDGQLALTISIPVVLGSLFLFTLIGLAVKLISDLMYVVVDPRVQFGSVAK